MKYVYLALLLMVSSVANATPLTLTPESTPVWTSNNNSTLTISEIMALIGYTDPLEQYYKAEVGGSDEGPFAASYETTFTNTSSEPADFLIEYLTGDSITCPDCYLLVKDGNHEPAQYVFEINGWDGVMDISGTGFWPEGGAISHVAIYGYVTDGGDNPGGNIPEPGTMALFGIGLLGMGMSRVRRKRKTL